jgi:hypothetical protein
MTVESATSINQLDATLPTATDPKSEGDNQIRLLKSVLKAQFPNFGSAAMTASHTELNYMVGVTSAVQTQLDARALKAGDTYTGTHNFSGATSVSVPTATAGDNSTKAASTAFVTAAAFSAALPAQTGNAGKVLSTDGTTASWTDTFTTSKSITGNLTFSGNGRRMYGNFDDITRANRFLFTNSGSSTQAALGVCPSVGGGIGASYEAFGGIDPDNSSVTSLFSNQFAFRAGIDSGKNGSGATLPLSFSIDGVEAFKVDETTKNVLVTGGGGLGYGAGSGGTVTQTTSKSTGVTLNKPCGQITTHNAALAAGTSVSFSLTNSNIALGDLIVVNGNMFLNYEYKTGLANAGAVSIIIKNISAGSLSDSLTINFAVIKSSLT